jgi:hypothetical protein
MSKLRNLRDIGLVLGGVLVGACLLSIPKQASSAFREGDAIMGAVIIEKDRQTRMDSRPDNPEGWGGITRFSSYYRPSRVSSRLFPNHDDCAAVKLDVWLNSGLLTYSHFNSEADASPTARTDDPGKTTMLLGGKNCQVRIVIERADGRSD